MMRNLNIRVSVKKKGSEWPSTFSPRRISWCRPLGSDNPVPPRHAVVPAIGGGAVVVVAGIVIGVYALAVVSLSIPPSTTVSTGTARRCERPGGHICIGCSWPGRCKRYHGRCRWQRGPACSRIATRSRDGNLLHNTVNLTLNVAHAHDTVVSH